MSGKQRGKRFKDLTGFEKEDLKVIEYSHYDTEKRKHFWRCECKKCGSIFILCTTDICKNINRTCKHVVEGQKYGKLTTIKNLGLKPIKNGKMFTFWECLCDCGDSVEVAETDLRSGHVKSCGCGVFKVLVGKAVGDVTIVTLDKEKSTKDNPHWICKCSCGLTFTKSHAWLKRKLKNENDDFWKCNHIKIGERFGKLTVLERLEKSEKYKCLCDCGEEKIYNRYELKNGEKTDCGCVYQKEYENLAGLEKNDWKVIKEVERGNSKEHRWLVYCKKCGKEWTLSSGIIKRHDGVCRHDRKEVTRNSKTYKGGITPLYEHLRSYIRPWIIDSFNYYNKTCVLTGYKNSSNLVIHHIYQFSYIVKESLQELNLEVKPQINLYSKEELKSIEELVLQKHYEHGFGICVTKEVHKLFHHIYGNTNTTPKDWEEFEKDFRDGKYNID